MCFCSGSREELEARQVHFIRSHLPDYETKRRQHVMTYESEDRARWEATESDKRRRQEQLERVISRPKPTHHKNWDGYWVENTRDHQVAPFVSVKRKPVPLSDGSRQYGGNDDHGRREGGVVQRAKTSYQRDGDWRRQEIARRTRAALDAQSSF